MDLSAGVAGAEYTIYDSNGNVYRTIVTGENGEVTFPKPNNGTYTYKETKAPEGYMIDKNVYSFTISDEKITGTLNISDYKKQEIEIVKKDANTFALLPGTGIEIYDSQGNLVAKGETGLDGIFPFIPEYDDIYTAIEVKAPEGYTLEGKVYIKFTIKNGKITGETTMYNTKDGEKIGRIDASYDHGPSGRGYAWIDENGILHFSKTGDDFRIGLVVFGWLIVAFGLIVLLKRRKRHEKK